MDFIKSKSSYVKRQKHSETKDGTIFERDIMTLGGLNLLSPNQKPIYTSGNFIISVDNTASVKRKVKKNAWVSNVDGTNSIWTLDNLSSLNSISSDTSSNEINISFNKDFYRLQDFSYYGSLSKMLESSLNNIINNFPGELYSPFLSTTSTEGSTIIFTSKYDGYHEYTLGYSDYSGNTNDDTSHIYLVLNPFSINFHVKNPTASVENIEKYFFYGNNKDNYQIIIGDDEETYNVEDLDVNFTLYDNEDLCPGSCLALIEFKDNKNTLIFDFKVYLGDNSSIYYLTTKEFLNIHVRPKQEIYDNFYNSLSIFEKYILTKKESTKTNNTYYISTFEFTQNTDDGIITTLEDFMLPLDRGRYNIDINSPSFGRTLGKFSKVASDYDDLYCDNLYRSMTHESIKNFDWTQNDDKEDYLEGANKISNIIRLFGREFDEIKGYIDNIRYTYNLSYNNKNNLPDYFLTDIGDIKGWDLYSIVPYDLTEYIKDEEGNKIYSGYTINSDYPNTATYEGKSGYTVVRNFSQSTISSVTPYAVNECIPYGYFKYCECGDDKTLKLKASEDSYDKLLHEDCATFNRILPYYSNEKFTYNDIYIEFLRRLCLNTPHIFKHKGTIEGIEEILGMFGLKSQRWVDSLSKTPQQKIECDGETLKETNYYKADYEVVEYTCFTNGIYDSYNEDKETTWINWFNSTKLISYDYNNDYEGLPVRSYDADNGQDKILYPFFGNVIDGDPYYQMNGGWMEISDFNFDKNNSIVLEKDDNVGIATAKLFTETYSYFRAVDNFTSIKELNASELHDGDIMYVENFKDDYLVVDNFDFYKIETDTLLIDDEYVNYKYFTYIVQPVSTKIGDVTFNDVLYISNPLYDTTNHIQTINIGELSNEEEVKIYICDEDTWENTINAINKSQEVSGFGFTMSDNYTSLLDRHLSYFIDTNLSANDSNYRFINFTESDYAEIGQDFKEYENGNYTNYFILHDSDNCNYYNKEYAWEQLEENDERYLKINTIIEKSKGNNPHIGHAIYDEGYEYIDYFNYLFKYALENDLINEDCYYNNTYEPSLDILQEIGFKKIIKESSIDGDNSKIGYKQYKDCKVHSFCDLIYNNNDSSTIDNPINRFFRNVVGNIGNDITKKKYGEDYHLTDIGRTNEDNKLLYGTDDSGNTIQNQSSISGLNDNVIISGIDTTDITDQIINTKRVDIIFNLHVKKGKMFSKQELEKKKYITSIVLPYLEQMIPSTTICKIGCKYIEISATTYTLNKIEAIRDQEWSATTANLDYSIKKTDYYNDGSVETEIINRSGKVTFEQNLSVSKVQRSGVYQDLDYSSIGIRWSLWQLAKATIEILNESGTDSTPMILSAKTSDSVKGTVYWTSNLEHLNIVKIEGNTLTFLKHYEGEMILFATADNASASKTVNISCGEIIVETKHKLDKIKENEKVQPYVTSATVNYTVIPIDVYKCGKEIEKDAISCSSGVTFQENTLETEVTRIGSFVDTNHSSIVIDWSVVQLGVRVIFEYNNGTIKRIYTTELSSKDISDKQNLISVKILEGVTTIKTSTFSGCTSLTSVTISSSITSIGEHTFDNCISLSSVTIPNSVTSIGSYAFNKCTSLSSITIPNSVTSIGEHTFSDCTSLLSAVIPNGITNINATFYNCSSLTSVTIPNSATSINATFYNCSSLASVKIPNSVASIGDSAFNNCYSLSSITIPNSVTSIGDSAFNNCTSLTSVTIPNSVTSIGKVIFKNCNYLSSIIVDNNTNYNDGNGCNCIIETSSNTLVQGCNTTIIPENVTSIASSAFEGFISLVSVIIPSGVTALNDYTFHDCESLTSVTIPNSVLSIGDRVFAFIRGTLTIKYNGTISQWNQITKKTQWRFNASVIIECTDGKINP